MGKSLPITREMITRLIATPSVSCTHASLDMSNSEVIDTLANWTEDIGFSLERQAVSPGKYNLIATVGSGSGGLVLSGHTDKVPRDDTNSGTATRSSSTKLVTLSMASVAAI
ncbi:MAG: acetylornithine deacetylase [Urechidicola sp.]|jgi:acetylornithine deacetylase